MSRCSKKCNDICAKVKSISGLSDNYVYTKLKYLEYVVNGIVNDINKYADKYYLNGVEENVKPLIEWLSRKGGV